METGQAIATQLAGKGYRVVLGCRVPAKALAAADEIKRLHPTATTICPKSPLDLGDLTSVTAFAKEIKGSVPTLGGLVLCAGIDGAPETRTPQGNELHMSVNHLGHMLLFLVSPFPTLHVSSISPGAFLSWNVAR